MSWEIFYLRISLYYIRKVIEVVVQNLACTFEIERGGNNTRWETRCHQLIFKFLP